MPNEIFPPKPDDLFSKDVIILLYGILITVNSLSEYMRAFRADSYDYFHYY